MTNRQLLLANSWREETRSNNPKVPVDEAIKRGRAYAEAGADIIFVESPESEEELRAVARSISVPVLANMVETGRTPYLPAARLQELGFKIAIYPATAFLAATWAVRSALSELRHRGRAEASLEHMLTLEEYHDILKFKDYVAIESRYSAS